jgi:glycosyltransferase involved in cell wall biosynthesis
MKIGIDISQMAFPGTGVALYTQNLVQHLLKIDRKNDYVLFYASLRKKLDENWLKSLPRERVTLKKYRLPPTLLEFLWNQLHFLPIDWLIGRVDVFFSSDWTQPPTQAKKVTTIHDLSPWRYPETFPAKIIQVQQRRMKWVKKEVDAILCDSQATKKDVVELLKIPEKRLKVVYPGGS